MNGKHLAWIIDFKATTGFECIYIEDFENGNMTFKEFADKNLHWIQEHMLESISAMEKSLYEINQEEEETK